VVALIAMPLIAMPLIAMPLIAMALIVTAGVAAMRMMAMPRCLIRGSLTLSSPLTGSLGWKHGVCGTFPGDGSPMSRA
jgi:hypothetical protein